MHSKPSTRIEAHVAGSSSALDPNYLAPSDVFYNSAANAALSARQRRERARSSERRRKPQFKKLLWFKQPCKLVEDLYLSKPKAHICTLVPDNYTDERTFLDHLQRNPRLQPYEFWSLMTDSTVIVQHVASVAIFCCTFVAIYMERVSPVSVVSWASICTFLAWALWDYWMGQEGTNKGQNNVNAASVTGDHSTNDSTASVEGEDKAQSNAEKEPPPTPGHSPYPPNIDPTSSLSPRNQERLATARSALIIVVALLGLSPILKSLTRSTTSDSIWALSTWLLFMNVAFFDYGSGSGGQ